LKYYSRAFQDTYLIFLKKSHYAGKRVLRVNVKPGGTPKATNLLFGGGNNSCLNEEDWR